MPVNEFLGHLKVAKHLMADVATNTIMVFKEIHVLSIEIAQ